MPAKKKQAKRRMDIARPYNGGEWSIARMRSFIMSALRRAQWPPRHKAVAKAFVGYGINPKTGRKCKLHKCEKCGATLPQGEMHADHRDAVIPLSHDWADGDHFVGYNWTEVVRRLYVEADAYSVMCRPCHKQITDAENAERRASKLL